ncbi:DUF4030 domain-containing protein [Fictibacillus fluitans]|uniref:DUF4030 domain-containing protein n=1 Tax=Fictibacillus fluitans TaxID=3058422 RepID=A0ABT8HVX7_9BACL|nr:DUF4030 domain-containing protein [Fictibacillus sp. NE201]MDN4524932.1 DUF4030 domain-containing protein [Fictibacillus sp. NE201]
MTDPLSNYVKKELDSIAIPEDRLNAAIAIGIERGKKKRRTPVKKFMFACCAAVVFFALFVSSGFVSPAMAKVVSKIPFLEILFREESVMPQVMDELKDRGIKVSGMGMSYQGKKTFSVTIDGDKAYYNKVKSEVKQATEGVLKENGYDAYTVSVEMPRKSDDSDGEVPEEMKKLEHLQASTSKEFENKKIKLVQFGISYNMGNPSIDIDVSDKSKRIDEIKAIIRENLKKEKLPAYPIHIKKINMKKVNQENRWGDVVSAMAQDLFGKKKFKTAGLGYTVHPKPKLTISTTIKSSDPDSRAYAKEIENSIERFFKTPQLKEKIKNDEYQIVILSKDKKRLN